MVSTEVEQEDFQPILTAFIMINKLKADIHQEDFVLGPYTWQDSATGSLGGDLVAVPFLQGDRGEVAAMMLQM